MYYVVEYENGRGPSMSEIDYTIEEAYDRLVKRISEDQNVICNPSDFNYYVANSIKVKPVVKLDFIIGD